MAQGISFSSDPVDRIRTIVKPVLVRFHNVTNDVLCKQDGSSQIRGAVRMVVSQSLKITSCNIELRGESVTNPLQTEDLPDDLSNVNPHAWSMIMSNLRVRDRESHVARKFVWKPNRDNTLPFPLQVKGSKCRPVTVLAEFRFPINRLLPETWAGNEDNNGSVKYWVEVEVKYVRPKWFGKGTRDPEEVSTWKSVVLRNEYALSTLNPTNPYLEKKMLSFDNCTWRSKHVGLWGSKKEIACYVHLPYRGFVQGELIPAEVFINNSSNRTVKNVCLEFIQVYKVISRKVPDQPCILNEIDSSIELEPVGPRSKWHRMVVGIRVPRFSRTDGSFPGNPLISVRFLVRLKIEFWLCNTLKCDVECHVGTKRTGASSAAVEKPTVNQQGLAFYPPNLKELVQVADLPFTLLDPTVRTPHK